MNLFPPVRANLAERFIFNFRMPPEALTKYLPAPWLTPQLVKGHAVASFCLLDLRDITFAPLPAVCGPASVSCAPRYAVMDTSGPEVRPSVFVTRRYTSSAFGSWLTRLACTAPHPHARAEIRREGRATMLRVGGLDEVASFSAEVRAAATDSSLLFPTPEAFAQFIAEGVSSYGLSLRGGRLTKIDLRKEDNGYEPLEVVRMDGPLVESWVADGAEFDSGYRTSGGRYEWTYTGLTK